MSAEEKQEFTFIWKIKHLHGNHSKKSHFIDSPLFEVESLKGIEWNILLCLFQQRLTCHIYRGGCSEHPGRIPINFQYELATSDGDILKTSDILSHTFSKIEYSYEYELIELVDRNTPEEVCLRCRMIVPRKTLLRKSSPCSVVGWEAETDFANPPYSFEFSLNFSDSSKWTAVEKVTLKSIPIDVKFKYVDDELQIELFYKIEGNTLHSVFCRTYLIDEKSEIVDSKFYRIQFSNTSGVWQLPSPFKKRQLEEAKCFSHKNLNIKMDFSYEYEYNYLIPEIKSFVGESTIVEDPASNQNKDEADNLSYLQQHLRNMLNEKTYADVKLRADDEVFFAHKCLLATWSPVFKAIFDQVTLESKINIIDIHDVEANILKIFLEYLYTGTVDGMDDEMATSLLVVADKYEVSPLSEKCSTFLKSVLSFDNVLNVLQVADRVNQEQLKVFAVEYVVENSTQVLTSPNWPQWMETNSTIASKVLREVSNKFDSSSKSNAV